MTEEEGQDGIVREEGEVQALRWKLRHQQCAARALYPMLSPRFWKSLRTMQGTHRPLIRTFLKFCLRWLFVELERIYIQATQGWFAFQIKISTGSSDNNDDSQRQLKGFPWLQVLPR